MVSQVVKKENESYMRITGTYIDLTIRALEPWIALAAISLDLIYACAPSKARFS